MQSQALIDQVLRQKSETKEIPGVVAIAATGKDVLYQGAFGKRDLSEPDAMTVDSVFWIASMTKAVTTAGAMQLVEQGKLSLDAPIGQVLPDIASPQVLEGFGAKGEPKLRPAKPPITLPDSMREAGRRRRERLASLTTPKLSCPAKAGHPVRRGFSVSQDRLWNTGSPAFAGDDT